MVLSFVTLEHVVPERLYFLDVPAFTVYRHARQQEPFRELTFQADLPHEWARGLLRLVIAQPKRIWQRNIHQ